MGRCSHQFIGTKQGVRCIRCGITLSPAQYAALTAPKKAGEKREGRSGRRRSEDE